MIDQITANTVGNEHNQKIEYSIPSLTNKELERVIATTTLLDIEDKKSLWNTFILIANYLGASITFNNSNDVDCLVEINFPRKKRSINNHQLITFIYCFKYQNRFNLYL